MKRRGLSGTPSEHATRFDTKIDQALTHIKEGERAKSCERMFTSAMQSASAGAVAAESLHYAFEGDAFRRKEAEKKLDSMVKRAVKLDQKFKDSCMRPSDGMLEGKRKRGR